MMSAAMKRLVTFAAATVVAVAVEFAGYGSVGGLIEWQK